MIVNLGSGDIRLQVNN